jgi:predicted NBD/HSP70 family sugar kinase
MEFEFSFSLPKLGRAVGHTVCRSLDAIDRQLTKIHDGVTRYGVSHPGFSRTFALSDKFHSISWIHDKVLIEQLRKELGLPVSTDKDSVEG